MFVRKVSSGVNFLDPSDGEGRMRRAFVTMGTTAPRNFRRKLVCSRNARRRRRNFGLVLAFDSDFAEF